MSENTPVTTDAPENTTAETAENTATPFTELGLDGRILAALEDLGYETPSPIQEQTIPLLLAGRDVVGLAQTGTGKTAAFALPALSRLAETIDVNGPGTSPRILVLAPTRELALQVAEAFTSYAKHLDNISVVPVYGGAPYGPQLAGLRRGAPVVVGTPGRVIDHIEKGSLDLSELDYLVLDEADEMLRMGFAEEVDKILSATPEGKQTALFSATMPSAIRRITGNYLNDAAEVRVSAQSTPATNIRQRYLQVTGPWKLEAMTRILETEDHDGVIAFVRTRNSTEELTAKLNARGFRAAAISGDIPQNLREKTVENLRSGAVDILVATDVAARGLDVERISHVINYDIPHDVASYVHRIGRTGRAGRKGDAVLLMTPREKYLLRAIEKTTKQTVEQIQLPSVDDVNTSRLSRFAEEITSTLAQSEENSLSVFRDLVDRYVDEHDVPAADVAAALAKIAQGGKSLLAEEPDLPPMRGGTGKNDRNDRDGRGSRGPNRGPAEGNATYWIAVGRKDRVQPGNIVGAIANEAGISARQIGGIDIRPTHSLVELPANLTSQQREALQHATINGRPLQLRLDSGRPTRAERERGGDDRGDRGGYNKGGYNKGGFKGGRGGFKGGHDNNRRDDRRGDSRDDSRGGYGEGRKKKDRWSSSDRKSRDSRY